MAVLRHALAICIALSLPSKSDAQSTAEDSVLTQLALHLSSDSLVETFYVVGWNKQNELYEAPSEAQVEFLAAELGGIVGSPPGRYPRCPWDLPAQVDTAVGWYLHITAPVVAADTADLEVWSDCKNPEGYLHNIFSRTEAYRFVRRNGSWHFLRKRLLRIT